MTSTVSKGAVPAVKRCTCGALLAAAITAAILAAEALILTKVDVGASAYGPMSTAASAIGAAAAAFVSGRKHGEKGLVFGGAIGCILSLVMIALGAVFADEAAVEGALYKAMTFITAGGLGGFLGIGGRAARR